MTPELCSTGEKKQTGGGGEIESKGLIPSFPIPSSNFKKQTVTGEVRHRVLIVSDSCHFLNLFLAKQCR